MELTAENVRMITTECAFRTGEMPEFKLEEEKRAWAEKNADIGHGLLAVFGFHKERLAARRPNIQSMLEQLPDKFRLDLPEAGGWSFLMMCERKDGVQWGGHMDMDILVVLAEASGLGGYILRKMAPGGVPYFG